MVRRGDLAARCIVAAALLIVVGVQLFYNLGVYRLWDDEANTALFGETVWRTGDTSAVIGHNIIAYGNGFELQGLYNRRIPPLQYYVEAPFVGILGPSSLAARLPFALFGMLSVALLIYWLWRDRAPLRIWVLMGLGTAANVSLMLYMRQARYYAPAMFFTLLVVYLYVHWDGKRRSLIALAASAVALCASHYIAYGALALCLVADYLLFSRSRLKFTWQQLALLAASQAVLVGAIVAVWNPLAKAQSAYVASNWLLAKLTLVWWYIRDANACEFGASVLLIVAPLLYFVTGRRNSWLIRLPLAFLLYEVAAALLSPEPVELVDFADVRYIVPTIPGLIALGVAVLESLPVHTVVRYSAALLLFYTNVINAGTAALIGVPTTRDTPRLMTDLPRSTQMAWLGELRNPLPSPYADVSEWINRNVTPEQTMLVVPGFATYPLMFHSPHVIYAGQLPRSEATTYPTLPDVHFKDSGAPDYIVAFGRFAPLARGVARSLARYGESYTVGAQLDVHWPDLTRPELFWHSFVPVPFGGQDTDGVLILRRQPEQQP